MSSYLSPDGWALAPSGIIVPTSSIRPLAMDLFCGCGGFSLGLIQAGYDVVAACDNDAPATLAYLLNLGAHPMQIHYATVEDKERLNACVERYAVSTEGGVVSISVTGSNRHNAAPGYSGVRHFFFGDLRAFESAFILDALGLERGDLDLIVGGPPCQGFSWMGKREIGDPRNELVFEFARKVVELQPGAIAMENVPEMLTMTMPDGRLVVDELCAILKRGDFAEHEALQRALKGRPTLRAVRSSKASKARVKQDPPAQISLLGV